MSEEKNTTIQIGSGVTLGSIIAVVLSWTINHSLMWAILHFFCSWAYVVWYAFMYWGGLKELF